MCWDRQKHGGKQGCLGLGVYVCCSPLKEKEKRNRLCRRSEGNQPTDCITEHTHTHTHTGRWQQELQMSVWVAAVAAGEGLSCSPWHSGSDRPMEVMWLCGEWGETRVGGVTRGYWGSDSVTTGAVDVGARSVMAAWGEEGPTATQWGQTVSQMIRWTINMFSSNHPFTILSFVYWSSDHFGYTLTGVEYCPQCHYNWVSHSFTRELCAADWNTQDALLLNLVVLLKDDFMTAVVKGSYWKLKLVAAQRQNIRFTCSDFHVILFTTLLTV